MEKLVNMTFEDFLQGIHAGLYPQTLDDDLPDAYQNWLGEMDAEKFIEWGEFYGQQQFLAGREKELYN